MAPFLLLPHSLIFVPTNTTIQSAKSPKPVPFIQSFKPRYALSPLKVSVSDDNATTTNGAPESPKPSRRVRKKKTTSTSISSSPSSSSSTSTAPRKTRRSKKTQVENGAIEAKPEKGTKKTSTSPTKTRRSRKTQVENGTIEAEPGKETEKTHPELDDEIANYDDGIDFPYLSPPLVCFFGAAQKEFVPQVRVHDNQMHPDIYSEWKMLQWDPPEFARSPGGPSSNVAIAHVRLGGRAAFMGKVGDDEFGKELVLLMNKEKVQTRAVKFDKDVKTARTYMKVTFGDGRMKMEVVKVAAEDSLRRSELNLAVLKEVNRIALQTCLNSELKGADFDEFFINGHLSIIWYGITDTK